MRDDTRANTPARVYALAMGIALTAAGIIGFFYESSFSDDPAVRDAVFGLLDVNGFHNVVHLASGLAGLLAYSAGAAASRSYATIFGVVYLAVAAWGFVIGDGESILNIIPVNTEDNILHLLLGLLGIAAAAASAERQRPARAT